jgi:putative transposase
MEAVKDVKDPTWISQEVAKERLGIGRCQFFLWLRRRKIASREIIVREAEKTGNGRWRREVGLDSLPAKYQARYLASAQADAESGPVILSGEADGAAQKAPSGLSLIGRSEDELNEATALAEHLDALLRSDDIPEAKQLLAVKLGVTERTVENWLASYKKSRLGGLVRKKRRDRGKARAANRKAVEWVKAEYIKPHQPSVKEIHEALSRQYIQSNIDAPSYSFVRSVCNSIDPDLVARCRIGEREYQNKFSYYAQRKKPPLPRMWVDGDHHQCDRPVIFRDGSIGRPWLTAIRDNCTLEILGFSVNANQTAGKYSNSRTIASVLRQGILRKQDERWPSFGLFDHFYTDLGKDFRSKYIRAICRDLSISWVPTRGYHGQSKPIERWFRTMEDQLRGLPGYIGNKPDNNPERQHIGAPRTWEEMRKDLMTIDQLEKELLDWILDRYHHADSKALKGISPMAALEAHNKKGWTVHEVSDERALDLLLMERIEQGGKNPIVRRGKIQAFGTTLEPRFFEAPELCELSGQDVQVYYDPDKIGELIIYKDNRFVCVAKNAELLSFGATKDDMKRRLEIERHQKRRLQERIDEMQARAQYGSTTEQASAERKYEEAEGELRRELVANAEPRRRVYKLLPRHQLAAKALKAVPKGLIAENAREAKEDNPWLKEDEAKPVEYKRERNPWLNEEPDRIPTSDELFPRKQNSDDDEDEFPKSEELFRRERKPYLEEEDTPQVCHKCEKGGTAFRYCLECPGERYCPKCHASSNHRFCSDCINAHTHIEALSDPPRSRPVDDGLKSSEELFGDSEAAPQRDDLLDSEELFKPEE